MRTQTAAKILALLLAAAVPLACGTAEDEPEVLPTPTPAEIPAYCQIDVQGVGTLDVETDYLPHVVQCENGGADLEALKAQAIAARSYAYYKIGVQGSVVDGQGDQVYSCNKTPTPDQVEAVHATAGQVLMYHELVIAAFYVAGSNPGDRATCIADSGDADPTNTEKYVTYNEGMSGDDVEQTTLGWVNPQNWENRGAMGQWGARCLEEDGRDYDSILRFYYGQDIVKANATGPCIDPPAVANHVARKSGPIEWVRSMRIGPN